MIQPNLKEIVTEMAAYTANSGFTVNIKKDIEGNDTVEINGSVNDNLFLSGHKDTGLIFSWQEATEFIADTNNLAIEANVDIEVARLAYAKRWIDY